MKIQFKRKKVDILVFDEVNKEILVSSILQDFDYDSLETRGKVLVVNFYILYRILSGIFGIFKKPTIINKLRELKKIYLVSVIDYISPKILITFIDNDPYFHAICRELNYIEGIAIQNGVRTHYNYHDKFNSLIHKKYLIPNYFVHGNHAEFLYKEYSHEYKNIFVVGSIKLDYFLSQAKNNINKYDLCLISTWAGGEEIIGDYPFSTKNQYKALLSIKDLVINESHNLVIALKTNNVAELNFYKEIFNDKVTYKMDNNDPFSAYNLCYQSKIILTTYSTLGFEFFAIGKNVVFFNLSGDDRYTHSIPNTITTLKNNELSNLVNQMLNEGIDCRYKSKNDVQCIQNKISSYEVIQEFMNKILKNK